MLHQARYRQKVAAVNRNQTASPGKESDREILAETHEFALQLNIRKAMRRYARILMPRQSLSNCTSKIRFLSFQRGRCYLRDLRFSSRFFKEIDQVISDLLKIAYSLIIAFVRITPNANTIVKIFFSRRS